MDKRGRDVILPKTLPLVQQLKEGRGFTGLESLPEEGWVYTPLWVCQLLEPALESQGPLKWIWKPKELVYSEPGALWESEITAFEGLIHKRSHLGTQCKGSSLKSD